MQGIEILVITLAAFFGLGIFFAILLWCRSWQRDQRDLTDRQIQTLQVQVERLRDAIEMLDPSTPRRAQGGDRRIGADTVQKDDAIETEDDRRRHIPFPVTTG